MLTRAEIIDEAVACLNAFISLMPLQFEADFGNRWMHEFERAAEEDPLLFRALVSNDTEDMPLFWAEIRGRSGLRPRQLPVCGPIKLNEDFAVVEAILSLLDDAKDRAFDEVSGLPVVKEYSVSEFVKRVHMRLTSEEPGRKLTIVNKNYKGETHRRTILPTRIFFHAKGFPDYSEEIAQYHPNPCWLLEAVDTDRDVVRTFELQNTDFSNGTVVLPE